MAVTNNGFLMYLLIELTDYFNTKAGENVIINLEII